MKTLPKTLPAFFLHFIKQQPWSFALFFLAPVTLVFEANVMPYALKLIIDGISENGHQRDKIFQIISPALWIGGAGWFAFAMVIRAQHWWQSRVIPRFEAQIRMEVFEHLMRHSHRFFADQLAGKLANKVSDLPRALESIRMVLCWNVVATSSVVISSLIIMGYVNPMFAWIFGVWISVHVALALRMARLVNQASAINADDKTSLNGAIVDTLSNMTSVRLFARRAHERVWTQRLQNIEMASHQRLTVRMNWLFFAGDMAFITMLSAMVYFLLSYWQLGGISTGGVIFIFNIVWGVTFQTWFLSQALADLFRDIGVAKQALSVVQTPIDLIDAPNAKSLQVDKGRIEFDHVSFHYNAGQSIFENKNVVIEPGQKVGLVGFSGSGKTTFAHLILRFFDVEAGRILIDGQDISKVTQDSLHQSIAMIPQDTGLFHRSLMENLRYGRLDATDEEVFEAARLAHCEEFIAQLPDGYQSLVGERGTKLSGGQRQRIAIARAFLKNAPILMLDEATSALDSVTERHIQDGLQALMQRRTTIVIAHRLSTLSNMDRILVFNKGHVVEDGSHEALLALGGHYARMWQMQAGGFLPESPPQAGEG